MSRKGGFIEIQGTGEEATFSRKELNQMLDLGQQGIDKLFECQDKALNK
jgi:ribonuclease PH